MRYNQAGFIKSSLKTTKTADVDKKNGPITKVTTKGAHHPYFFKLPEQSPGKLIPVIEAVGAHLMRLVFGPTTVPKTRYVINSTFPSRSFSISTMIPDFHPATRMPAEVRHKISAHHAAKLHLKILCFQDPDLHGINWSIDAHGNLVLPDNDRLFGEFSNQMRKGTDAFMTPHHMDAADIFIWKNLLYTVNDAFSVISEEDIINTLEFKDLKPYNHPFISSSEHLFSVGPEVKKQDCLTWRFFYLTKYLMLLTPERVRHIIADHSPENSDFRKTFFDEIMMHKAKIEQVLFYMSAYQDFLTKDLLEYRDTMQLEISNYNAEFIDKNNHEKPHKAHHIVRCDMQHRLNAEIDAFVQTARACFNADTQAKKAQRAIQLCLARLQRDGNALTTIPEIKKNNEERMKGFDRDIRDSHLPRGQIAHYTPATVRNLKRFLEKHGLNHSEIAIYILNNGTKTLTACISTLRAHLEKQKKHLKTCEDNIMADFLRQIGELTRLLKEQGADFTEEDIKTIILFMNQMPTLFNLSFIDIFLQKITGEKIPSEFWTWFCEHIDETKIQRYLPDQQSNFKMFCRSMVNLKKMSVPKMGGALVGDSPYTLQLNYKNTDCTFAAKNILTLLQEKDHCITVSAADFAIFTAGLKSRFGAVRFTGFEKQNDYNNYQIQLTFKDYQLYLLAKPLEPRAVSAPPGETKTISRGFGRR